MHPFKNHMGSASDGSASSVVETGLLWADCLAHLHDAMRLPSTTTLAMKMRSCIGYSCYLLRLLLHISLLTVGFVGVNLMHVGGGRPACGTGRAVMASNA